MRIIKIATIAQLISWAVFILGDYVQETFSNELLLLVAVIVVPVMIPVLYLIYQKKIHYESIPKWVNTMTMLLVWAAGNVFITMFIGALMEKDLWVNHQAHDEWGDMLNGVEYAIFTIFNMALPIIIVVIGIVISFIHNIIKAKRSC